MSNSANPKLTLANARRRLIQTFWITVTSVPFWVIAHGGLYDAFTWDHIGLVALAAAVIWVLMFISDLIVDACSRPDQNEVP
jgi:heme/copper-type cytochrome/quinol oxidase subunit 4